MNTDVQTYGVTVEYMRDAFRTFPHHARQQAIQDEILRARAMIEGGKGETNRDEIVRALNRALWIMSNG